MCPANLARRASERTPASDPALRTPACELPSRTAPASPGERSCLAIPLANPSERSRHPCHQCIGPLSAPISMHRTSRFFLALGATECSRSTLPASGSGKVSPWCVPRRRSVAVFHFMRFQRGLGREKRPFLAIFRSCAFSGCQPWRDFAVACSQTLADGKTLAKCVSRRSTVARYRSDAFPKGPRTKKMPVRGKILPPCIQNELVLARFARYASENRRKAPFGNAPREDLAVKVPFSLRGPLESRMARKSCHPLTISAFRWRGAFPEGWGALSLLLWWCGLGRPCLAGKLPVSSLSSGRSPSICLSWRMVRIRLLASTDWGRT